MKRCGRELPNGLMSITGGPDKILFILNELMQLPGLRCHELKGDRKGQYAIKLTGFYRIIFTVIGKKLEIACIEEVSKHYDD